MFRRIMSLARPQWRTLAWGALFLVISSSMGLAYPQAIRVIIDEVLGARNPAMIDWAALAMLVIFAVQGVAGALRYYLFTVAGERVVTELRERMFRGIL
ncbi:MAG: ABC transporter transmembrane domain-containing protein, partial [Myxococcota bacterium]|nr:ABC transporter transmembrane domain-containing protein [Myxococcota bacterium]